MAKGISVHVGLNHVQGPGISVHDLKGCESDAKAMHELAIAQNFISESPLLGEKSTYENVVKAITAASTVLIDGDFFLFTFSGHGTQRDALIFHEEPDALDEGLVLYDSILFDNVFKFVLWPEFNKGVRILAVSDSCNSGGSFFLPLDATDNIAPEAIWISNAAPSRTSGAESLEDDIVSIGGGLTRSIPNFQRERHIEMLPDFYREVRESIDRNSDRNIDASLLVLAACDERGKTADGVPHGVFTQALIDIWNNGSFAGNYVTFRNEIENRPPGQKPVLVPEDADPIFKAQRPFTI